MRQKLILFKGFRRRWPVEELQFQEKIRYDPGGRPEDEKDHEKEKENEKEPADHIARQRIT